MCQGLRDFMESTDCLGPVAVDTNPFRVFFLEFTRKSPLSHDSFPKPFVFSRRSSISCSIVLLTFTIVLIFVYMAFGRIWQHGKYSYGVWQ